MKLFNCIILSAFSMIIVSSILLLLAIAGNQLFHGILNVSIILLLVGIVIVKVCDKIRMEVLQ